MSSPPDKNKISTEEKYIKAFKASPDAISITRISDGMFVEVNSRLAKLSGYSADEIVGKTSQEISLWNDHEQREIFFREIQKNKGSISDFAADLCKKDGEIRNCLLSAETIEINNEPCILTVTRDITETKKLQDELKDSEDRFNKAFKASPYAITISRFSDGLILDANQKWAEISGYTLDELIGHTSRELNLWEKQEQRDALIDKLKKGGSVIDYEAGLRTKKGDIRAVSLCAETITLNNDAYIIITTKDVTETKVLQKKLRDSEEKFSKAFKSLSDPVCISTLDGTIMDVNNSFLENSGYKFSEVIGKNIIRDLGGWENPDLRKKIIDELQKNGEIKNIEANFVRKDGNITYCIISASIISIDTIPNLLFLTRDITEQKKARQKLIESEERFKNAFSKAPTGIVLIDNNGCIFQANPRVQEIFGFPLEEIYGMSIKDMTHPNDVESSMAQFEKLMNNEIHNYQMRKRCCHKQDGFVWCKVSASTLNDASGKTLYIIAHIEDISSEIKYEEEINKLLLSIEHSPNVVMITDPDSVIEYVNPKFSEITGYSSEEIIGKKPDILAANGNNSSIYAKLWNTIKEGKEWRGEFLNRKKNGDTYWASQIIFPIKNSNMEITHYVGLHDDTTEARKISEQLSYQASHDMLTDLINRAEFEKRLERILNTAKKENSENILCFMDLDQFKLVNDACGHMAGDEFLRQLANVLKNTVRHRDILARLGGDEFALLMERCPLEQGLKVTEQIRSAIESFQFFWEEKYFSVGVSIGLTVINNESHDLTELLKQADAACYTAKDMGRNRIHVYQEDDLALATRRGEMNWAQKLNDALMHNQFKLYAQKIIPVSSSSEDIRSYEILLRLDNPGGDPISPNAFIAAADRYNLNTKIDHWVIDNFMLWLKKNSAFFDKAPAHFSINLSGSSINDQQIKELIIKHLESDYVKAENITFEITETAAIANFIAANKFMAELSKYGCKFSLDDFGSGLSSFAYLKNLPTDTLKIDGMFVKDIDHNDNDLAMVKIINEIGHTMDMKTVAEFVENEAIMNKLKEIGVNYAQGYWVGKVHPIDTILENDK